MSSLLLLIAISWACTKSPETAATYQEAVSEATAIQPTPEQLMQQIDAAIVAGDSIVNSIESNEESLEGGEEIAYYDSDIELTKIKKVSYGETYQSIDAFYFAASGKILAITSETLRYSKSVYDESPEPMKLSSEGKYTLLLDETEKLSVYQKIQSKRKFEDKTEANELAYWLDKGHSLWETFTVQKDKFFYSQYESYQYDATGANPLFVYKIKDQLFSFFDASTEPNGRELELNSPILTVVKLIYDTNSGTWKQSQKATIIDYSSGDVSVTDKIEKVTLDGRTFLLISFKTKESKTGKVETYFTLIDTLDLSTQSLIKSGGKDNAGTFTSATIKQFLLAKAQ